MTGSNQGEPRIIDPVRRKSVHKGPEEQVRQAVIGHLTETMGIPLGLISVEKEIDGSASAYRADLVVYLRSGKPWLIVECKAPDVPLTQAAFDQIGNYNRTIHARYMLITNGVNHYCSEWDGSNNEIKYLDRLPMYPQEP